MSETSQRSASDCDDLLRGRSEEEPACSGVGSAMALGGLQDADGVPVADQEPDKDELELAGRDDKGADIAAQPGYTAQDPGDGKDAHAARASASIAQAEGSIVLAAAASTGAANGNYSLERDTSGGHSSEKQQSPRAPLPERLFSMQRHANAPAGQAPTASTDGAPERAAELRRSSAGACAPTSCGHLTLGAPQVAMSPEVTMQHASAHDALLLPGTIVSLPEHDVASSHPDSSWRLHEIVLADGTNVSVFLYETGSHRFASAIR